MFISILATILLLFNLVKVAHCLCILQANMKPLDYINLKKKKKGKDGDTFYVFQPIRKALEVCFMKYLGAAHKLIGNALPISARVCKVKIAMNLVHVGKINGLCLLSTCFCCVYGF